MESKFQHLTHLFHFVHNNNVPSKFKTAIFTLFFNAFHQVPFQEHLRNRFREKAKDTDFGSQNALFVTFWAQ